MRSLSFYCVSKEKLESFIVSAMRAGFKTYFAPPNNKRLMVEYIINDDNKEINGTWSIWNSDALDIYPEEPEILGDFEIEMIETLKPKAIYNVGFHPYSSAKLVKLLKTFLDDIEGWIVVPYAEVYYTSENLGDISSVLD